MGLLHLKRKGFTLIELLVVISIIGLLSSVVLAALSTAKSKARVAAGLNFADHNHHKLGVDEFVDYQFDSASNPGLDSSGNNYNLTFSGSSISIDTTNTPNGHGSSLKSTATAYAYTLASFPQDSLMGTAQNGFTITYWINNQAVSGPSPQEFAVNFNSVNSFSYLSCLGGRFLGKISSNTIFDIPTPACSDINTWHNITWDYNNTTKANTLYVDGVAISGPTIIDISSTVNNITAIAVACSWPNYYGSIVGNLDTFRIYRSTLTASEVQKLYAEGLPTHTIAVK